MERQEVETNTVDAPPPWGTQKKNSNKLHNFVICDLISIIEHQPKNINLLIDTLSRFGFRRISRMGSVTSLSDFEQTALAWTCGRWWRKTNGLCITDVCHTRIWTNVGRPSGTRKSTGRLKKIIYLFYYLKLVFLHSF